MALEKRVVSINFASGVDTKTEAKLTTKLTTADNVVLRKNGTIEKRLGFVADGSWSVNGNPVKAFPFRDGEVAITDWSTNTAITSNMNTNVARVASSWTAQDRFASAGIRTRTLFSDARSVSVSDVAIIGWSATQAGSAAVVSSMTSAAKYIVSDLGTEASFATDDATTSKAVIRSLTAGSLTAIIFQTNSQTVVISHGTSSTIFSVTSIASIATSNPQLDAVAIGSKIYFACKENSTTGIIVGSYDPATTTVSTTTIAASGTADMISLATPVAGTDRVRLTWTVGGAVRIASFSLTLSTIQASAQIQNFAITVPIQIAGCENTGATTWDLFASFTSSATVPTAATPVTTGWIATYSNTSATVASNSPVTVMPGVVMAAKPFLAHGRPHVLLNWSQSGSQSFILTKLGAANSPYLQPVGRCLYGLAGPNNSATWEWLPQIASSDTESFWTVARRAVYFSSLGSQITVAYGAELVRFNVSQTAILPFSQVNDVTMLGGGSMQLYDSGGVVEAGFYTPLAIVASSVTTSGGSVTVGTYSVVAVKEFTDLSGHTFRSQPSQPLTLTSSATTSAFTIQIIDGPTARQSRQYSDRIAFYRTQGNGSIYYRDVTNYTISANRVTLGGPGVTVSLTVSDSTLSGSDIIYTQGGALPNWMPDGVVAMCQHKSRLWCNDSTDTGIVRYSKQFVSGEGAAFAQANVVKVPGLGIVTALGSMDSTLIVFRSRSIYGVAGDGPDDTGLNGAFSDGQLLFGDIGCIDQRSMCRFRDGIIFKSADKGFYLLTRDLQLQYIGQDVESYNSKTVVSSEVVGIAEIDGTAEECRFLCSDGTLLTYNYYNSQWTTATLSGCVDAVQTGGRYVVVNTSTTATNARVFQQSTSTYTDDFMSPGSVTYQMTVETGWIKTGDIQGFQRVYKVGVLGEAQGPGKFTVEVGYDYESAYAETHTATMSSLTAANYTGGQTSAPQTDFTPARQKCQAIRFRIKDIPDPGGGAVVKLTNLTMEVGLKSGKFLLPASKGI